MSSQTEIPATFGHYPVAGVGAGTAWSNSSNAGTTGGFYATNTNITSPGDTLQGTNCGFSVTGTVNGAQFSFSHFADNNTTSHHVADTNVSLVLASPGTSPTLSANNYALTVNKWPTTATSITYGTGTTDQWGSAGSFTTTVINSSAFGGLLCAAATNSSDIASVNSFSVTVYYTGGSPPGAPTGLTVTTDATTPSTALDLSWTAPSGSPTSYTIERAASIGGTFSVLASGVTGTAYVDSSLTPGTEYAYQVAGVNGGGTGSYSTPEAYATEPAAPSGLTATPVSTSQINLAWTAPSLGSTVTILEYNLYVRVTGSGGFAMFSAGTGTSYNLSSLSPGTSYDFEIQAEIQSNNSDWSGDVAGLTSSVVTASTFAYAIPAICHIVMARTIDDYSCEQMPL